MSEYDHAPAILQWWAHVQKNGGLAATERSATVSTMLFGCYRWLELQDDISSPPHAAQIEFIKNELENWMSARGLFFKG